MEEKRKISVNSPARGNKTIFFTLLYVLVAGFVFSVIFELVGLDTGSGYVGALLYILVLFIPFLFYLLFTRQSHKNVLKWKTPGKRTVILAIILSIAMIPFLSVVSHLSSLIFHPLIDEYMTEITAYPLWFSLISVAVLPAFIEEFIFRGALYKEFERLPIKKVAIITGLFFAIIHLNFHQAIYAMLLGIVYAYVLFYTQSIWVPILMHFVNNGIFVVLAYVPVVNGYAETSEMLLSDMIFLGVFSLLMLPVVIICFKKLKANAVAPPAYDEEPEHPTGRKPKILTWAFWVTLAIFLLFAIFIEVERFF